jgi:uncharacterized membrane protein
MDFALFSTDGFLFFLRWLHFYFGIIWIGLLYYFNYVQVPFMGEADAAAKSTVVQKLVPRALWWFRWGAMYTFVTGLLILMIRGHQGTFAVFSTSWGVSILTGALFATLMWANVWFVIWPNQKIVIQSATQAAGGGQALPNAAAAGARALVASRTNAMFSVPMLFYMGAASHLPVGTGESSCFGTYWAIVGLIAAGLELNALKGKVGPMATVKGVITCGFVLAAAVYVIMEIAL